MSILLKFTWKHKNTSYFKPATLPVLITQMGLQQKMIQRGEACETLFETKSQRNWTKSKQKSYGTEIWQGSCSKEVQCDSVKKRQRNPPLLPRNRRFPFPNFLSCQLTFFNHLRQTFFHNYLPIFSLNRYYFCQIKIWGRFYEDKK